MDARQIMNDSAEWKTLGRAAHDCYHAIYFVTDSADWDESRVLYESTLNAWDFMQEAIK